MLPVRLINTTNERRLVQGHETTPLRVKGDIEVVSSKLGDGVEGCTFLDETLRILLFSMNRSSDPLIRSRPHSNPQTDRLFACENNLNRSFENETQKAAEVTIHDRS
ncbi:hypothetical protein TNCV_4896241 [Trichonephila clavipes]|uniref:Uncharacterized protein n=1 Tax=Trichonephila clavipes TaxID=2585209 RepID=A0A8X7B9F4_TRICX|nr:hypothetical protein TNCV_4896241 [Trichonephila clavipes]